MIHKRAYMLSRLQSSYPQKMKALFYNLSKRVRERFSRQTKPLQHLGGKSPLTHGEIQDQVLPLDRERDLDFCCRIGISHEYKDMDIYIDKK